MAEPKYDKIGTSENFALLINEVLATASTFNDNIDGCKVSKPKPNCVVVTTPENDYFVIEVRKISETYAKLMSHD